MGRHRNLHFCPQQLFFIAGTKVDQSPDSGIFALFLRKNWLLLQRDLVKGESCFSKNLAIVCYVYKTGKCLWNSARTFRIGCERLGWWQWGVLGRSKFQKKKSWLDWETDSRYKAKQEGAQDDLKVWGGLIDRMLVPGIEIGMTEEELVSEWRWHIYF